jgi:hypothetical protein
LCGEKGADHHFPTESLVHPIPWRTVGQSLSRGHSQPGTPKCTRRMAAVTALACAASAQLTRGWGRAGEAEWERTLRWSRMGWERRALRA